MNNPGSRHGPRGWVPPLIPSGRQERDLTAFAVRAGYEVVGMFRETGSGARTGLNGGR